MRVLFTTAPLHGHFYTVVPLALACRSMGHEVLVATSDHFVTAASHSGLPVTSCGPGIGVHDLADPAAAHGVRDARYAHGEVFARMALRNLTGTAAIVGSWRPDVVVAERAELAGPIAAAAAGVPYAELHWGVAELAEYRAAAEAVLHPSLRRFGLDRLPSADVVVNPWPPSLRPPYARGHLGLRHVPYDGVARMARWMFEPARPTRICFTLGTVLPRLATKGLLGLVGEMLDSLARLDCELIVAVEDELAGRLGPLPPAVRHAGRVPLSEVLRTCRILVHHGGQGTSLTALAVGRPQVVLPMFDDQIENADAVVRSGAALPLRLDEAAPRRLAQHCRRLLAEPRFNDCAWAMAREIADQPSPVDIAAALERLASGAWHQPVPAELGV